MLPAAKAAGSIAAERQIAFDSNGKTSFKARHRIDVQAAML